MIGYDTIFGIKTANFSLTPGQFRLPHILAITMGSFFLLNSIYFYLAIRSSIPLIVVINSTFYCLYSFAMWIINGPNIFYLFGVIFFPLLSFIILYNKKRKSIVDADEDEKEDDNEEELENENN